jgi:hypothetical protein
MAVDFQSLKKNRSKSLEKLNEQLTKITSKSYADPNEGKYWKPTRDSAGNGFAIIRFLDSPQGEDMPFVRLWDHGFKGSSTGLWYIENSLTTIGQPDPVSELNSKLWNMNNDDGSPERKQARDQKRRLHYISNVYIVKDSGNPENEGKVFLFKYGKKIWDKLNDLMNPSFEDEKPVNPFDLWEGANFRLKIRMFEGYPNYDKSEFDSPSAFFEDDDEIERVWKQSHSLKEVIDPKNFKSYDELKAKLHRTLGIAGSDADVRSKASASAEEDLYEELDMSKVQAPKKEAPAAAMKEQASPSVEEDDDDLEFFRNLSKG